MTTPVFSPNARTCLLYSIGSPLFSVESELGQTEFACGEVEHGDEVGG